MGRPRVLTEVRVMGAGGDDERVVADRTAVGEADLPSFGVKVDRLAEEDGRVRLRAED